MMTINASTISGALFATVASATMLSFAIAPAHAASVPVTVAAHELATPEGRAQVDARIERAAARVCGVTNGRTPLAEQARTRACAVETLAAARSQVAVAKMKFQMAAR